MLLLAFILSIVGLSNNLTSVAGVVLGIIELRKIDRGNLPRKGASSRAGRSSSGLSSSH